MKSLLKRVLRSGPFGRFSLWLGYVRGPRFMSTMRRSWAIVRNPLATIEIHPTARLGPGFRLQMPAGGTFVAGPYVEFRRGFHAELAGPDARIVIGAFSVFSHYVLIQCTTSIEIGERAMFGQSAILVDGNHRFRDLDKPMLEQGYDFRPIKIEDDVTTTTKCTIINSIGMRAFVGANSVVTQPIPAYTVAAGVPARVIDYFGPPGEEPPGFKPASESQAARK